MTMILSQLNSHFTPISPLFSYQVPISMKCDSDLECVKTLKLFKQSIKSTFFDKIKAMIGKNLTWLFELKEKKELFYYTKKCCEDEKQNMVIAKTKTILQKGYLIDKQDTLGNTNLHYACENFNYPLIELLLAFGAKHDIKNNKHKTPLMILLDSYPAILKKPYRKHNRMSVIKHFIEMDGFETIYNKKSHFYFCKLFDVLIAEQFLQLTNHQNLIDNMIKFIQIYYQKDSQQYNFDFMFDFLKQYQCIDKLFNVSMELHNDIYQYFDCYREKHQLELNVKKDAPLNRIKKNHKI